MTIEHIGLQVSDPIELADWYCANLGFTVRRSQDDPWPVRFIADSAGGGMIEIYRNPSLDVPDYSKIPPLHLHIALTCADVDDTYDRLLAAGATPASPPGTTPVGDRLAILRDPWGISVQLCKRATSIS